MYANLRLRFRYRASTNSGKLYNKPQNKVRQPSQAQTTGDTSSNGTQCDDDDLTGSPEKSYFLHRPNRNALHNTCSLSVHAADVCALGRGINHRATALWSLTNIKPRQTMFQSLNFFVFVVCLLFDLVEARRHPAGTKSLKKQTTRSKKPF